MSIDTLVARYADWVVRRRWLVISATLLAVVVLGSFLGRLAFDTNYRIWFEADDPYLKSYDLFIEEFGNDDMFVVAFKDDAGIMRDAPVATIRRLTDAFWKVTGVIRVDSIANFQATRAVDDGISIEALFPEDEPATKDRITAAADYIDSEPLVLGSLITSDGKVAILRAKFAPNAINPKLPAQVYGELRKILDAEQAATGYHFHIAGGPITDQAFDEVAQTDMGKLVPMVLVVLVLILAIVFRSLLGVALPIGIAALAIVATLGLTGLAGFKLNAITASMPHLLLGITVATTMHILSSFLTARREGGSTAEAVRAALAKNLVPVALTSATTSIGFFSFMFASIVPVKRLGFMAGCGTLVILALSITLVPAVLSFCKKQPRATLLQRLKFGKRLDAIGRGVVARPIRVIGIWLLLGGGLAAFLPQLVVDSNPVGYFNHSHWFRQSIDFIENEGSGGAVYEIVVRGMGPESVKTVGYMRDLDRLTDYLLEQAPGDFTNVYSLSTIVRNINRSLHGDDDAMHVIPDEDTAIGQFLLLYTLSVPVGQDINDRINIDYSASRLTVIRPLVSSRVSRYNIDVIEAWAAANLSNVQIEFTGRDVLYTNMGNNVSSSLLQSLLFAVFSVTLVIFSIFRSIKAALVSLIPNLLPLVMVMGFMGMTGVLLDVGTIMVASVGFGIAVDDTIHFLAHYFRARKQGAIPVDAVRATVVQVGTPVTVTTVALTSAYLMFLLANFMPNFYFGLLLSLILVIALLADLSLLPAVLYTLERKRGKQTAQTTGVAAAESA